MRSLARLNQNEYAKVRTLYAGSTLALAAGLLLGAAMKPDLAAFERPEGPQIISQGPQAGPTGPFDDRLTYAGYSGQIPDYVLGTDWKKLVEAPLPAAEPEPDVTYYDSPVLDEEPPRAEVGVYTPAVYRTPAEDLGAYPSLSGGAAYEDVSRAEKTPLAPLTDLDEEAPPEATGDTTLAR